MNKLLLTTAIIMALGGTTALAHHPAADIVDPDIYAMIDENVADTPHADLTFDDMDGMASDSNNDTATEASTFAGGGAADSLGGDTSAIGAATESADGVRNAGELFDGGDSTDVGSSLDVGASFSGDILEEVGEAQETRDVNNAEVELSSPGPGPDGDSGSDFSPGAGSGK